MTPSFQQFVDRYNKSTEAKPATESDIDKIEKEFEINFPADYKEFLLHFGNVWTPHILDIIVDKAEEINDVQQFWDIDSIIYDKKNEWTSQVTPDIIPFASDCMGNIFAFLRSDLETQKVTAEIYFFDHDFDTVDKIAASFTEWLDRFNKL